MPADFSHPRAWIEIGGQAVPWQLLLRAEIDNTLYMAADSADLVLRNDTLISDYLRKDMEVRIWIGYVRNPDAWGRDELTHLFTGRIDGILPLFGKGMTVRVMCRDLSARLIDSHFTGSWENLTSSELATRLFQSRGLTPVVTPTSTAIERDLVYDRREWEILQGMAERDGFVCYVDKDGRGYYGPRAETDEITEAAIRYRQGPGSNVVDEFEFEDTRINVVNRVVVRHYLGRTKGYVEGMAEDAEHIAQYGLNQRIIHDSHATSTALADQIAAQKLAIYRRVAVTGRGRVVGNPQLRAEAKVAALGFGRFDGPYYIDRAKHVLNKSNGYLTDLTVASLRPENAFQYRSDLRRERGETTTR